MKYFLITFWVLGFILGCGSTHNGLQPGNNTGSSLDDLSRLQVQVQKDSLNWESHYLLAQAYLSHGEYENAENEFDLALTLNPLALEATIGKATLYRQLNKLTDAYSLYLKVIQTDGSEKYYPRIAQAVGAPYETEQLTHGDYHNAAPVFSPDGKTIAFQSNRDGNMEIYTLDLTTRYERRITHHPARDELPTFGPNGKRLAFNSTRNDSSDRPEAEKMRDIYSCDPEGNNLTRFTDTTDDDWYPRFHPKKEQLVFVSTRDDIREIQFSQQWSDLYLLDLNRGELERLTNDKYQTGCPAFTPDGKAIIFNSNVNDEKFHLYRLELNSAKIEQLTFHQANDAAPDLDKSGKRIVFFSDINGNFDLFLFNLFNNEIQQLTCQGFDEAYPRFSPDGNRIVYQAKVRTKYHLFLLNCQQPIKKDSLVKIIENKMTEISQQTAKR